MSTSIRIFLFAALVTIVQHAAHSQSFTNLDFEAANVPILAPGEPGGLVPVGLAMPGWNAYFGGQQAPVVLYNQLTLGSSAVALIGPNFQFLGSPLQTSENRFSVALNAGDGGPTLNPASISQVGLVPSGSLSIQARITTSSPDFIVSLNGTPITMQPLLITPGYTLYGGDISAFSGQTATLAFTAPPTPANPFYAFGLDSIAFSSMPVPEPSVIALAATGGLFLGIRRWHNSRKRI